MRLFFRLLMATALAALAAPAAQAQTTAAAPGSAARTLLVVGDSLSAEYGLARGTGWVPLLAGRMSEQYPNYQVVNASISGDTTSGGVSRLPALLTRHHPAILVLDLGPNHAPTGRSP